MSDELRLVALGFPLSDAVTLCATMRRDGVLENFINEQERLFRDSIVPELPEVPDGLF